MNTSASENRRRIGYVDIAKCLGMFAVMWGHILLSGWSNHFVYAFDIPLFFFLSGLVFNREKYTSFGAFLIRRVKTLLIPYLIFSVLTWGLWACYSYLLHDTPESYIKPLLQTFIAQGSGGYLEHNIPLWFVTCLFVVEILYYFISRANDAVNLFICAACAVIGHFAIRENFFISEKVFNFKELPWNTEVAFAAIIFYAAGNIFAKRFGKRSVDTVASKKPFISIGAVVLFTAATAVLGLWNVKNDHNISFGSDNLGKNTVIVYVAGFCGIISTLLFSALADRLSEKKVFDKIIGFMKWIGRNSFYFMVIHVPIKGFVVNVISTIVKVSVDDMCASMAWSALTFIGTLAGSCIAVFVICLIVKAFKKKKA